MAHLMRNLSCVLLLAAVCVAQQQQQEQRQSSQQSSQVKLEDIERDTNQRPQGAVQPGAQGQVSEVPQLSPQQIAAFQQQYLVQPQQYFAPQFAFPEFQGVPLTYVPAGGNHLGVGNANVSPYQAYFVPQQSHGLPQHVVPVYNGQQAPIEAYRAPFGQQFIQHPQPQQQQQGAPQQGTRTISVLPPNNAVYRTIQPPFGANLIYTNPPALPQQLIFTQHQPQPQAPFGVNAFQQRPSKAQFSSGVKSTPATPTKSPDYNNYSQASPSSSASSSAGSTASNEQYRFQG